MYVYIYTVLCMDLLLLLLQYPQYLMITATAVLIHATYNICNSYSVVLGQVGVRVRASITDSKLSSTVYSTVKYLGRHAAISGSLSPSSQGFG